MCLLRLTCCQARLDSLTCIEEMVKAVGPTLSQPAAEAARQCAEAVKAVDRAAALSVAERILGALPSPMQE